MLLSWEKSKPELTATGLNAPAGRLKAKQHSSFLLLDAASGKTWWLKDGANRVGRSFDNDIVVTDESVSRRHAKITVTGGNIYIEDLNSANGTCIGQERIARSALFVDAVLKLGKVELILKRPTLMDDTPQWQL